MVLKEAALDLLTKGDSIELVCRKKGVDQDALERFLRLNRHRLLREIELESGDTPAAAGVAALSLVSATERKKHRPKAQQGEHAVLHAVIEELAPVDPIEDPLYLGVDRMGRAISFERVLLIALVSAFLVSIFVFGYKGLLSGVPETSPEAKRQSPQENADMDDTARAAEVMADFASAENWEERSQFVRHSNIVAPRMKQW